MPSLGQREIGTAHGIIILLSLIKTQKKRANSSGGASHPSGDQTGGCQPWNHLWFSSIRIIHSSLNYPTSTISQHRGVKNIFVVLDYFETTVLGTRNTYKHIGVTSCDVNIFASAQAFRLYLERASVFENICNAEVSWVLEDYICKCAGDNCKCARFFASRKR